MSRNSWDVILPVLETGLPLLMKIAAALVGFAVVLWACRYLFG